MNRRSMTKYGAVVGASALVLGLGATGGAVADQMIGSAQIKNHSIKGKDLATDSVRHRQLYKHSVSWENLKKATKDKIENEAGQPGPQGPQGPPGDPASDVLGGLSAHKQVPPTTIDKIGGKFAENATQLGTVDLEPGTYLVSAYGYFDRANDTDAYNGTVLQLSLQDSSGKPFGTCFTGTFPSGDREQTCDSTIVVTVDEPTTVSIKAFGYNADQSSQGSGNYVVAADISAVQVGQQTATQ